MIVAVHQPNYLPYLGFFHKMLRADVLVLYDTAQFSKNDFHNRNRLKSPRGATWITIPVRRPTKREIREVDIDTSRRWTDSHWETIKANYSRAPGFDLLSTELQSLYKGTWTKLAEANIAFITMLAKALGVTTRVLRASNLDLPIGLSASERLAAIVERVDGDSYLSGPGGANYLDLNAFRDKTVLMQEFHHPEYRQMWGPFIPEMSALDLVLNLGLGARTILPDCGSVRPWGQARLD